MSRPSRRGISHPFNVGEPIAFQPAVAAGRIYVGTTAGSLIAIETGDRAADGWLMWGGDGTHNGRAAQVAAVCES
ncbi:MAG TPA: PQQ-binding-like beta-propeller repeat protein [Planctomycetaceae bacterium]|nr:PQQ-binding-like beta-propeller repeat protein [Planctomycetaceae bacterium]